MKTLLRGNILYSTKLGQLNALERGYIALEEGVVRGVFLQPPTAYAAWPVEDWGERIILPAPVDTHLHAPQFPVLGSGMGQTLLPWLNSYVLPAEARFADPAYAEWAYSALAQALVRQGTTRAVVFGSIHGATTPLLMAAFQQAGLRALVGKVNMDRESPAYYVERTQASLDDTRRWLDQTLAAYSLVSPILTPRFIPSCTDQLLEGLARIREAYRLPVQSHLSENQSEVQWVKRLHPDCPTYAHAYHKFGLLGEDTAMAHCVLSGPEEIALLRNTHTLAVHCPDSNLNLMSGIAPVRRLLNAGVRVALGSDIAGGAELSMFHVMASAIRVSKLLCLESGERPLSAREAFYLGTAPGAALFGQHPLGEGEGLHALVVDDGAAQLDLEARLERLLYLIEPGWIVRRYAQGRVIGE